MVAMGKTQDGCEKQIIQTLYTRDERQTCRCVPCVNRPEDRVRSRIILLIGVFTVAAAAALVVAVQVRKFDRLVISCTAADAAAAATVNTSEYP